MVADARTESLGAARGMRRPSPPAILGSILVALVLVWLIVNLVKTPDDFVSNLIIGVTNGAVYGLIAIGYSLVYGILELINFAHGDIFMLGGMMTATLVSALGLAAGDAGYVLVGGILLMLLVAMAFCAGLNTGTERVAYRRLRHAPRIAPLITAIGMSFIFQNVGLIWKGARPVSVPNILPHGTVFTIPIGDGVAYTWNKLIVLLITFPVLLALTYLVQRTRQGKAMRATAQDQDAAAMMGIDVNRTISFTFALAGCLAGSAGVIYALYFTNITFLTGFRVGLIAFTAAVVGGIGNLPGAVLGAMLIGLIEAFVNGLGWHSPGSNWTEAVIFAILILILVFRPEGLLGERTPEGG
jgi:branched-chain amino acid transport system permease protein